MDRKLGRLIYPLFLAVFPLTVSAQTFDDWHVQALDDETLVANTNSSSGASLFKVCYVSTQNCMWAFSPGSQCNDGEQYQVLINADSGARAMQVHCIGAKKAGQLLLLGDYQAVDNVSANDDVLGIALAMADGQFRVIRFSMKGSQEATQAVQLGVLDAAKNPRDLTL